MSFSYAVNAVKQALRDAEAKCGNYNGGSKEDKFKLHDFVALKSVGKLNGALKLALKWIKSIIVGETISYILSH